MIWLEDCDASMNHHVGGKCANLGELIKAHVPVPPGFAITTEAHRAFLTRNHVADDVRDWLASLDIDDLEAVEAVSADLRQRFETAVIPADVEEAIRTAYAELARRCGDHAVPVAVRSSATAEDLYTASFAGQLETYLWIRGADEVVQHTLRCWAGLFTPHALIYRAKMGYATEEAVMSVCVQQMVRARTAGVMFTLNPTNGDRSKIMVEACWGLGEGLVSGGITPDQYLIDKVTLSVVKRTVSEKKVEYQFDPAAGKVRPVPVGDDRRNQPALADEEIVQLAQVAKRLERYYGRPQDIEWAIGVDASVPDGPNRVHILQSRAETVWSQAQAKSIVQPSVGAMDLMLAKLMNPEGRS